MIVRTHDRLMAANNADSKQNLSRVKEMMGFSRKDNAVAEVQVIEENEVGTDSHILSSTALSANLGRSSGRVRKGHGRRTK